MGKRFKPLKPLRQAPVFVRPLIEAAIAGLIVIGCCLFLFHNPIGAMVVGAITFSRIIGGLVTEAFRGFWHDNL
jgi:hypothetical protein